MEENKNKNKEDMVRDTFKQALEERQTTRLSSNFSHLTMKRVYQEAERQRKRKVVYSWVALLTAVVFLLGLGVYAFVFYLDLSFTSFIPKLDIEQSASYFRFYIYIAVLVLALLGLDYWLHKKYIWK